MVVFWTSNQKAICTNYFCVNEFDLIWDPLSILDVLAVERNLIMLKNFKISILFFEELPGKLESGEICGLCTEATANSNDFV